MYSLIQSNTQNDGLEDASNIMGIRQLNYIDKEMFQKAKTYTDYYKELNRMQSKKRHACDGLTVVFYRKSWPIVGQILVDKLNYSFIKGELS